MKAFLLAGGLGKRLQPLTLEIPKCLVPIRGVPLLEIWLSLCERYGIDQVLLNVVQRPERVEEFLCQRRSGRTSVHLVREARPAGTAGTVLAHRAFVAGEESFWVIYSDNLTNMALDRMLEFHCSHAGPLTMGLFRTADPHAAGIVELSESGRIIGFEEKPRRPRSDLANAGIYLVRQAVLNMIPFRRPLVDFGHDVLPRLVGKMFGYPIPEYYVDIGTPAALARAEVDWGSLHAGTSAGMDTGSQGEAPE
jgi:mannose-1-phosphate guanylyltransferase